MDLAHRVADRYKAKRVEQLVRSQVKSALKVKISDTGDVLVTLTDGKEAEKLASTLRKAGYGQVKLREPRGELRPYYIINAYPLAKTG